MTCLSGLRVHSLYNSKFKRLEKLHPFLARSPFLFFSFKFHLVVSFDHALVVHFVALLCNLAKVNPTKNKQNYICSFILFIRRGRSYFRIDKH